jgi:hypothetical protein
MGGRLITHRGSERPSTWVVFHNPGVQRSRCPKVGPRWRIAPLQRGAPLHSKTSPAPSRRTGGRTSSSLHASRARLSRLDWCTSALASGSRSCCSATSTWGQGRGGRQRRVGACGHVSKGLAVWAAAGHHHSSSAACRSDRYSSSSSGDGSSSSSRGNNVALRPLSVGWLAFGPASPRPRGPPVCSSDWQPPWAGGHHPMGTAGSCSGCSNPGRPPRT